ISGNLCNNSRNLLHRIQESRMYFCKNSGYCHGKCTSNKSNRTNESVVWIFGKNIEPCNEPAKCHLVCKLCRCGKTTKPVKCQPSVTKRSDLLWYLNRNE